MSTDSRKALRIAIILAGGLGKRMGSPIPKVLRSIHKKSMIVRILENCMPIVDQVFIVVGNFRQDIEFAIETQMGSTPEMIRALRHKIKFVNQYQARGTGHAVQCVKLDPYSGLEEMMGMDTRALILCGDVPLISRETMEEMFRVDGVLNTKMATTQMDEPVGYGRVLCSSGGEFLRIVEEKDASEEEKACRLVNCGIYSFHCGSLFENVMKLDNKNSQGEYYLTDMVAIVRDAVAGNRVEMMEIAREKQYEVMGVNTAEQLSRVKEIFERIGK